MTVGWRALALVGLVACGGATGTYGVELKTAPGSTVLDRVARARLTLSVPFRQVEAVRGTDGKFHLDLEVPANGPIGYVTFEGFDDSGALVGWGRSGALPIAAIDASIAIYVAPPQSLAAAPVALDPPRTEIGVGLFSFGALLVGGAGAGGAARREVAIYDLYAHDFLPGEDLPAARAAATVTTGATGYAYVYGGRGADGQPTGTLARFDTTVSPGGLWQSLDSEPQLARAGAAAAQIGPEVYLATGDPPAVIDGRTVSLTAATTLPALAGTLSSVAIDDAFYLVAVGDGSGATGVVRVTASGAVEVAASARRTGHGAAVTDGNLVVVLGGAVAGAPTRAGLIVDAVAGNSREIADALVTARTGAAVASTGSVVLVAGGRDAGGALLADAELLDAATLAPIATLPLVVPRAGAVAARLGNGQIMLLGGVDAAGAPVATIELFTPARP